MRYNTIFGAVNLSVLIVMPVLRNVHEIPFPMWTPYDVNKSLPFFCFMYAFQLGNAIFAGGANLAVNMFVYLTLVMMEYALNLLGARFMRLGTAIDQSANYKDIVNCVKLHWQIEKYDESSSDHKSHTHWFRLCESFAAWPERCISYSTHYCTFRWFSPHFYLQILDFCSSP